MTNENSPVTWKLLLTIILTVIGSVATAVWVASGVYHDLIASNEKLSTNIAKVQQDLHIVVTDQRDMRDELTRIAANNKALMHKLDMASVNSNIIDDSIETVFVTPGEDEKPTIDDSYYLIEVATLKGSLENLKSDEIISTGHLINWRVEALESELERVQVQSNELGGVFYFVSSMYLDESINDLEKIHLEYMNQDTVSAFGEIRDALKGRKVRLDINSLRNEIDNEYQAYKMKPQGLLDYIEAYPQKLIPQK